MIVLYCVHFKKMVENNEKHGQGAKEDCERVEIVVGNHGGG